MDSVSTNFSSTTTTDDGGGVMKNAAVENCVPWQWCRLHSGDIPRKWALGQAGTENTRTEQQNRAGAFIARMSAMVTIFNKSTQATQGLAEHAKKLATEWLEVIATVVGDASIEGTEPSLTQEALQDLTWPYAIFREIFFEIWVCGKMRNSAKFWRNLGAFAKFGGRSEIWERTQVAAWCPLMMQVVMALELVGSRNKYKIG